MVFGLALVAVMLLALSVGGISSLYSYRSVVDELDNSFRDRAARDELWAAVVELDAPLLELAADLPRSDPARTDRARENFRRQLDDLTEQINNYKRGIDNLPLDPGQGTLRQFAVQSLLDVFKAVHRLEQLELRLSNADERADVVHEIQRRVDRLQLQVLAIPDFSHGFQDTLEHAKSAYHTGFWLVCGSSAVVVVLFTWFVWYGGRCVFTPMQKLHKGALRVAQGDFDYRVQIPGPEEMSELADAFNSVADRFKEIRDDLDRQVRERFRQLVRSERLAGIGFLAAGVAHEINNPLQAIAFAAESLDSRTPEPRTEEERADVELAHQYLGMIQREAFRCQQITKKLLEFSRGNGEARGRHDLTAIVNEVLALVRPMSKYHDRAIEFARTAPCSIEANGPEIQQVVLNLVSNSLEAMESGGTLRIDITEQASQVVLTFSDDGCGMTPDVIENLFEPFFTQRRDGRGTGLGLSISHRIISAHGGTIDAASDGPGKGSTFRVILPRNSFRAGTAA